MATTTFLHVVRRRVCLDEPTAEALHDLVDEIGRGPPLLTELV